MRFIRCEDITFVDAIRCPGMQPGVASSQAAYLQCRPSSAHPLMLEIDLETKMVKVAHEGVEDKPFSCFYAPLSNVKDFRVYRGKTSPAPGPTGGKAAEAPASK